MNEHQCFYQAQRLGTMNVKSKIFSICVTLAMMGIITSASSQDNNHWQAKTSIAPSFRVSDLSGEPGKKIKLDIILPPVAKNIDTSITFYGLPGQLLLSEGVRKSEVWIVSSRYANKLTLIAPRGFNRNFEAAAILRKPDGNVIQGHRFHVHISKIARKKQTKKKIDVAKLKVKPAKKEKVEPKKVAVAPKKVTVEPKKVAVEPKKGTVESKKVNAAKKKAPAKQEPEMKAEPKEKEALEKPSEAQKTAEKSKPVVPSVKVKPKNEYDSVFIKNLLAKSKQLIQSGNITAARETLKFLANQGIAEGAFIVGRTYDPKEFKHLNTLGMVPDIKEAIRWYAKAAKLGHTEAELRMKKYQKPGL